MWGLCHINNQDYTASLLHITPFFFHLRVEENGIYLLLDLLFLWLGILAVLGLMFLLKEYDKIYLASSSTWGFPRVFPSEELNLRLSKDLSDAERLLILLFH